MAMEIRNSNSGKENGELKVPLIDQSNYIQWKWENVMRWILGLDNGRFVQYFESLEQSLKEEKVTGVDLKQIDILDVRRWGVVNCMDKQALIGYIQGLLSAANDIYLG